MNRARLFTIALTLLLAAAHGAWTQAPTVMIYQGRLLTNDGTDTPVDGTVAVDFAIFNIASGGSSVPWVSRWSTNRATKPRTSILRGTPSR